MTPTRARGAQDSAGANSRRCGGSRELLAPSPAKAGEGWGGVSFGSARPVGTPSQPPPAVAGGGAKSSRLPPLLQTAQESPRQRSAPPVADAAAVLPRQPVDHSQQPAHRFGSRHGGIGTAHVRLHPARVNGGTDEHA